MARGFAHSQSAVKLSSPWTLSIYHLISPIPRMYSKYAKLDNESPPPQEMHQINNLLVKLRAGDIIASMRRQRG